MNLFLNKPLEVVTELLSLLSDNKWSVRFGAVEALGQLGNADPEIMTGLVPMLGDEESLVRYGAAKVFGQLGQANLEVVSILPEGVTSTL